MLKKTVLVHALSLAFSAGIATVVLSSSAYAQSQTTGSVSGQAVSGSVISVENKSIGISRKITAGADGSFSVSQLPPGNYTLTTTYADGSTEQIPVTVAPGEGSSASFSGPAVGQKVVITGRSTRIDMKNPESSMVLSKEAIDRVPVSRDVTATPASARPACAPVTYLRWAAHRRRKTSTTSTASTSPTR